MQDLLEQLITRLSETRLLRLAEVRYLTSFIQELEDRAGNYTRPNLSRPPNQPDITEAERLFIEERGVLEDRRPRRTETSARPQPVRASRPQRPIVANAPTNPGRRNTRIRRAGPTSRTNTQVPARNIRRQQVSHLTRRPSARQVQQAGNIVIDQVAEQLSQDIHRLARQHAQNTVRTTRTANHVNSSFNS